MNGPTADVRLISAKLETLRPTQITVGYHEVRAKRAHWKSLDKKARAQAIATHWFAAVLGPGHQHFVVDHHHLGLALIEEGLSDVKVMLLRDHDPYRSLAGELRRLGGYAKDMTPFSEFLWADYLRLKLPEKRVRKDCDKALKEALACAHDPEARYLPGWSGKLPVS